MAEFKKINYEIKHVFDQKNCRHFLNGRVSVLHCHHFMTLYTQLAKDSGKTDVLKNVAEETFYEVLNNYFIENNINDIEDKIELACQYYSAIGLGNILIASLGDDSGEVEALRSHVDEGWIKKWGNHDSEVNYVTCGYISAAFSAINNLKIGVYETIEKESIVKGAKTSKFKVYKKA